MPLIARVAVPLPVFEAYSYLVPDDLREEARVGCRVLVPFGPRRLTGLIIQVGDQEPEGDFKLKPLRDVLDDEPAFTTEMLRLSKWIADYYVCGWGEVVKAMLPTGTDVESQHHLARTDAPAGTWAEHAKGRRILRYLAEHDDATLGGLRKQVKNVPLGLLRRMARDGVLTLETTLSDPKVRVKTERHLRFAPAFRHAGAAKDLTEQLRGHKQVAVVETLAGLAAEGTREPRQADVLERAQAASSTVRSLIDRGIVETVEKEVIRTPLGWAEAPTGPPKKHALHEAQAAALGRIGEAVAAERFEAFLLHGVTGSGKTEVYIQALKQVLARGKTGIILVPEIALTPQTVRRFQAHFGDRIAVLHSRMSLGERYDAWRHLRTGRFQVVIGPRSAVLAPLENLGLIVVDEEHEPSYKQFDPAPRYHARDVAVMRAHMNDAVCVLGSATPSIESYANAKAGKYTLLPMPERVPVPGRTAAAMPDVEVVDLTLERKKHRLDGALSVPLVEAIEARLTREEQVILLQNRRGYAPVLECEGCGFSPTCPDCSVTLTFHKAKRHLRCHYCGYAERTPHVCPSCHEAALARLGTGTQRVEEELHERFPEARVLRMDMDTTSRKDAHHQLLDQFGKGEADILLGTQMVAKGLDFERVTLVGVINADTGLLLPDFRSDERTFQLLTQVAGRAGRAERPGEVLLQTRNPDHSALRHAVGHDYDRFVEETMPMRAELGYPPYCRLVGIEFRGPDEGAVAETADRWTRLLMQQAAGLDVLGPEPAFVARVKRQYRYHTLLKAPHRYQAKALQRILRATQDAFGAPPKGLRIAIDVDPVGLF